jgi:DNA modification methylase
MMIRAETDSDVVRVGEPVHAETVAAEWVDIKTLRPWAKNPRKNDGEPVVKVAESIKRFGFAAPIIARLETREIIAGHTRWKAAQQLKLERVPVRFVDLSEREAHLLALADNRLGELAEWDTPELHELLRSYDLGDQMLAGWVDKDLREMERLIRSSTELADDDAPTPPTQPVTQPGDLWLLGRHRLVCGDATDAKHVALARAKLEPFIMVTDPPYGVKYDPAWRRKDKLRAGIGHGGARDPDGTERTDPIENDDRSSWVEAYKLFAGPVAYVWYAAKQVAIAVDDLTRAQLRVRSQIVWKKQQAVVGRGHYHWQHEPCFYAVRDGHPARWAGDRKQSTVWDISNRPNDPTDETTHSAQKPIECMARPIRNHGLAGDVVYDPFCGSGTTLIAAEQLDRTCVALEISPAYCDVIIQRWQAVTGKKAERG